MRITAGLLIALALSASPALAHDEDWDWPKESKNLKVLPKDTTPEKLSSVMSAWSRALGVGCEFCHVGKHDQPMSTWDFASDDPEHKGIARDMFRMVQSIEGQLGKMQAGHEPIRVGCQTCHRGRPRPLSLEAELRDVQKKKGLDEAVAHYKKLRERFLERGAYDFSEGSLNALGYRLLADGDAASAVAWLRLNAQQFPQSANVWDSLAEAYMTLGKPEQAQIYYRKSLELDPDNENAEKMLAKLAAGGEPKK